MIKLLFLILNLAVISLVLSSIISFSYWSSSSRFSVLSNSMYSSFVSLFSSTQNSFLPLIFSVFFYLVFLNLFSNIPLSVSPVLYYFFSMSLSFVLWVSLIFVVLSTQLKSFVAHLLPFGAPIFLAILLPLIELFSQIIRPLTLMIRLSTNLSAGHIMLYMFSFFSLSSTLLCLSVFLLLLCLILLEISISLLQAYIFTSLSYIYISESL